MEDRRITDPREVARRMAESVTSDLRGFVFDRRIIDPSVVSRLVAVGGIEKFLVRYREGNVIVYAVSARLAEARCRQGDCRNVPAEKRRACIASCMHRVIEEMARAVAESVVDAASALEG